ncbi:uncharacterized protein KY384_003475 [Bacidia gigantensis]|uniref:uncharacterized protein n=1 Tax=Bacidia gigantensis TaxID=2732470 RepID=UPI001D040306|nr:uncharacterized protein KY384_003475 [Bacidia gigantensis]KAG8531839.1 hypothetical protein KY384_003475 [Bacidia gigantensis]
MELYRVAASTDTSSPLSPPGLSTLALPTPHTSTLELSVFGSRIDDSRKVFTGLKNPQELRSPNITATTGQRSITHLAYQNFELLNHYVSTASQSLSTRPTVREIWQNVYVEGNARLWEMKARRHQSLALATSIPAFQQVTQDNCDALFATSGIIAMIAFTLPCSIPEDVLSSIDHITDFFVLLRGIHTVLQSALGWILGGRLGPTTGYDFDPPSQPLADNLNTRFADLKRLVDQQNSKTALQDT